MMANKCEWILQILYKQRVYNSESERGDVSIEKIQPTYRRSADRHPASFMLCNPGRRRRDRGGAACAVRLPRLRLHHSRQKSGILWHLLGARNRCSVRGEPDKKQRLCQGFGFVGIPSCLLHLPSDVGQAGTVSVQSAVLRRERRLPQIRQSGRKSRHNAGLLERRCIKRRASQPVLLRKAAIFRHGFGGNRLKRTAILH